MEGIRGIVEYDMTTLRGPLANAFIILINALFFHVKLIGVPDIYPKDFGDFLMQEYEDVFDFIIVGAGSAGCSLANRLTEDEKWSVLLIEAGNYPSITSEVPAFYRLLVGSEEDWKFVLEKDEKACKSFEGERCTLSKGKVLGGTSTINNLLYIRASTYDYDVNDFESWGSNVSYAIHNRLENYNGPIIHNVIHGRNGLIRLDHENFTGSSKTLLQKTYRSVGILSKPHRQDIGFEDHLVTQRFGERINMAKNFLTPIKDRPNLFLTTDSEVTGIVLTEPIDRRVSGVNVTVQDVPLFIKARKEVILTAGAINNAKLLLASGIGPRNYIESKGLQSYVDIPGVGKNLQMHLLVPLYVAYEPLTACDREFYTEKDLITDTFNYIINRNGNFTNTDVNELTTYISTFKSSGSLPNLAIHHKNFKIDDNNLEAWTESLKYDLKISKTLVKYNRERSILVFLIKLLHPLSRGEVFLNDTHYLSNPKIIPRFMSDIKNMDFQVLYSGFDFVTNLTDAMKDVKAEFLDLDIPNCRNYKFCTPAYVKCYIHNMAFPEDVTSTVFMGPDCDTNAVVKENLEVRGIRCLRVADSSVLNNIPIGNTVSSDAMIGFKMGEILREKWQKGYQSEYLPHHSD
ncbi:glucose dehydrogenase [FAD, quinone]-like [Diorhabda carinulata]|uniref:glucose dehydrogenase [FAD, quinone]-like n=1 Tax=Diorhabda carinulata TaxID=1163345 RepID=UPI0025A1BA90|nr:glucose dehydrogenase [FAD, quinone]-like [Diorhabda carinulata]